MIVECSGARISHSCDALYSHVLINCTGCHAHLQWPLVPAAFLLTRNTCPGDMRELCLQWFCATPVNSKKFDIKHQIEFRRRHIGFEYRIDLMLLHLLQMRRRARACSRRVTSTRRPVALVSLCFCRITQRICCSRAC